MSRSDSDRLTPEELRTVIDNLWARNRRELDPSIAKLQHPLDRITEAEEAEG